MDNEGQDKQISIDYMIAVDKIIKLVALSSGKTEKEASSIVCKALNEFYSNNGYK